LVLWLVAACDNTQAQATKTASSKTRGTHGAVGCTKDTQCPSGQRCGFTSGCESKGKCIVPSKTPSCIDPGGRCGCDGRPVDILCAVGSRTEYTSAPANAVGLCPRPCTEELGCGAGSGLVCQKGFCVKTQRVFPDRYHKCSWRNSAPRKALDFTGCNSRPGTGSLHPVAIETAAEATKLSELSM
jgi:hypothetical protein